MNRLAPSLDSPGLRELLARPRIKEGFQTFADEWRQYTRAGFAVVALDRVLVEVSREALAEAAQAEDAGRGSVEFVVHAGSRVTASTLKDVKTAQRALALAQGPRSDVAGLGAGDPGY